MADPNVAADHLRLLIERIERLEEEKKGISDDIRDVYGEAKSTGYDVKTIRAVVRLRKMEKHVREEAEAMLETYKAALGMDYSDTPLGSATVRRAVQDFQRSTEGVAVSMSMDGGPAVPLNEEALYQQAVELVKANDKASTSWLQRQLRIGYNSAARLIERMERENLVSAPDHVGARRVMALAQ
tara:strand:+ start:787 stop:1338 length:552 start_codon:yes stop_codon:yes gene_type:complete